MVRLLPVFVAVLLVGFFDIHSVWAAAALGSAMFIASNAVVLLMNPLPAYRSRVRYRRLAPRPREMRSSTIRGNPNG